MMPLLGLPRATPSDFNSLSPLRSPATTPNGSSPVPVLAGDDDAHTSIQVAIQARNTIGFVYPRTVRCVHCPSTGLQPGIRCSPENPNCDRPPPDIRCRRPNPPRPCRGSEICCPMKSSCFSSPFDSDISRCRSSFSFMSRASSHSRSSA
jgi:hypothetical protein